MESKIKLPRYMWFLPWVLVGFISLGTVFWAGYFVAQNSSAIVNERVLELEDLVQKKESLVLDLQRDLAQTKVGNKLDQQVVLEVQKQLSDLEHQLSDQKDEITYYREYIDPKNRNKSVQVRSFELYASKNTQDEGGENYNPREFNYKLVLQSGDIDVEEESVKVDISLEMENLQTKKVEVLLLDGGKADVRFKYFKSLRGKIVVPLNMKPKRVVIKLDTASNKDIKQHFTWKVEK